MTINIDYEKIAALIHEYYRLQALKEGWKNDFPMLYPELPEFMKSDTRSGFRRRSRPKLSVVSNSRPVRVIRSCERSIGLIQHGCDPYDRGLLDAKRAEGTNYASERALRPAVIWRNLC